MSTTLRQRHQRNEDGFSTLSTLIGAALGAMVIGGFMLFWFHADEASQSNVAVSQQEGDAVKVLNRAGRDIGDADVVVQNDPTDVVVERIAKDGRNSSITRTRYVVVEREFGGKTSQVMVRQVDEDASSAYSADDFDMDSETVLASEVDATKTKFDYKTRTGSTVAAGSDATTVGRVDITYVAKTKSGNVELKSSATVNTALGGRGNGALDGPQAVDDGVTLIAGDGALLNVLSNDTFGSEPTVTSASVAPITVSVNASNQVQITASASITVPAVYTVPYTLTDESGKSDTANITVAVMVRTTPATPSRVDVCTTDGRDTLTIPARNGVVYRVETRNATTNAVVTPVADIAPGTYTVTGEVIKVVTAVAATLPEPGYVLTGTTSWTLSFTEMPCYVEPWVSEGPVSLSDADGRSTIAWSGGALRYVRMAGADANSAAGVLMTSMRGQMEMSAGLGTDYLYFIDKDNDGVWDSTDSSTMKAEQSFRLLQHPTVPTVAAAGSDRNRDLVPDALGQNLVTWTKGATTAKTDVRMYRSYLVDSSVYLKPGFTTPITGQTGTSAVDTASRGSEAVYDAVAFTRCVTSRNAPATDCASYNFDADTRVNKMDQYAAAPAARAYQAPSATPVGVTSGDSAAGNCFARDNVRTVNVIAGGAANQAYNCGDGLGALAWSDDNGDNGASADGRFCDYGGNPGGCQVKATEPDHPGARYSTSNSVAVGQSAWNTRDTWSTYSCNLGGCNTAPSNTSMRSFPGPFATSGVTMPPNRRYQNMLVWYNNQCWTSACSEQNTDSMKVAWNNSSGINSGGGRYSFNAIPAWGVVTAYPSDTGPYVADTGTWPSGVEKAETDFLTGFKQMSGYNVTAAANSSTNPGFVRRTTSGVTGNANTRVYTSPGHVAYMQDSSFCNPSVNSGWRYGYWFSRQIIDHQGEPRNGQGGAVRYMWWASRMFNGQSEEQTGATAARRWLVGTNNPATWAAPGNWTTTTEYYANVNVGATQNSWIQGLTGSNTNLIPPDGASASGRAHVRVEVYMTNAEASDPDYADLTYWTGVNSAGADTYGSTTSSIQGADIRARSTGNTASQISSCSASTKSNSTQYSFSASAPGWYTMQDGFQVTRRYRNAANTFGTRGNPNPNVGNTVYWRQAG